VASPLPTSVGWRSAPAHLCKLVLHPQMWAMEDGFTLQRWLVGGWRCTLRRGGLHLHRLSIQFFFFLYFSWFFFLIINLFFGVHMWYGDMVLDTHGEFLLGSRGKMLAGKYNGKTYLSLDQNFFFLFFFLMTRNPSNARPLRIPTLVR
jgi:hypothetical protein